MNILIAETDLILLRAMKEGFEEAGHVVTIVNDSMGAWGYLAGASPPDLLVTRLFLGRGKPPGTALGLHAFTRTPPIPVIYIPSDHQRAEHADPKHGAILVSPLPSAILLKPSSVCLAKNGAS